MKVIIFILVLVTIMHGPTYAATVPKHTLAQKIVASCASLLTLTAAGNVLAHRFIDNQNLAMSGLTTRIRSSRDTMGFVKLLGRLLLRKVADEEEGQEEVEFNTAYIDNNKLQEELVWGQSAASIETSMNDIVLTENPDAPNSGIFYFHGFIGTFSMEKAEEGWALILRSAVSSRLLYRGVILYNSTSARVP